MSSRGVTVMPSASTFASTSLTSFTDSSPLGPLTLTVLPSTEAVTPLGRATGFLPIRDILFSSPSESRTEHFAADVLFTGCAVCHHALRRRNNRKAEALAVRFDFRRAGVDAAARSRDALQLANDRLAFVILEFNFDFLAAAVLEFDFRITADEAFFLQHIEHARTQFRVRRFDFRQAAKLSIADARQE